MRRFFWIAVAVAVGAVARKADGCDGKRSKCHAPTPAPTFHDPVLARAAAVAEWFRAAADTKGRRRAPAPADWIVRSVADVAGPGGEATPLLPLAHGNAKRVFRGTVRGAGAVVKASSANHTRDRAGGNVYLELVYLEALRGRPGVPRLFGAWADGPHVWWAVADAGEPLAAAGEGRGRTRAVAGERYRSLATKEPLAAARALLACFDSFSGAGFFLDDFKPQQFAVRGGAIALVDGPSLLGASALGRYVSRTAPGCKNVLAAAPAACAVDGDCPRTKAHHACAAERDCERGSRGAPEARGLCRGAPVPGCAALSARTHVYDVASRPWLLPFIIATAEDRAAAAVLARLAEAMRAPDARDRPSFPDLLAALNATDL